MGAAKLGITMLVDNRAGAGLTAEHGLSIWIDTGDRRVLFDTGQGPALLANAPALGIELSRADTLVLSHGHYDHTGALEPVLGAGDRIELYAHAGVVQPRYSIRDGQVRPISMSHDAVAALDRMDSERLHWVSGPLWLDETIGLSGPIARHTLYEDTGGPFYLDPEGSRADPISDDLALWIRTGGGLVVCVGCSHAGLINSLNQIRRLEPGQPIRAVIGGFHLVAASEERLRRTAAALRDLAPGCLMPCHCTGDAATAYLKASLGEMVQPANAGMTFRF